MSLLKAKLLKNSTIKESASMEKSTFFTPRDMAPTMVYALNIAYSGSLFGGVSDGLAGFAGPSKHFKSLYTLISVKAYLDKYPDAICLFYDSEFGTPTAYFESVGIDISRVIHTPISNIEDLKFDIMKQLDDITKGERVIFAVDSIGNLASKKEVEDALKENSAADMSRAKQLKGLMRMITPILKIKNLPMIIINHTYQCGTEEMTVLTPDRGAVSLKEIEIGDSVYTTNGIEEVTFTTTHEDAWVSDITLEDGTILSFTSGHRFMVDGEWKFVEDIVEGDVIQQNNAKGLKVTKVEFATRKANVYDFETPSHNYILGNGLISHNTQEMFSKTVVSGGCVIYGTKIQMSDGTIKEVQEIEVGELVKTPVGDHSVTHVWNPDTLAYGHPECFQIEFEDGSKFTISDNDHLFVDGKLVKIKDLKVDDEVDVL